jgi:hypothetical protein
LSAVRSSLNRSMTPVSGLCYPAGTMGRRCSQLDT